jgi:hypothetical protein
LVYESLLREHFFMVAETYKHIFYRSCMHAYRTHLIDPHDDIVTRVFTLSYFFISRVIEVSNLEIYVGITYCDLIFFSYNSKCLMVQVGSNF